MKSLALVALLLTCSLANADDKPKAGSSQEVTISLANTPKQVADNIKVGASVDIIVDEPGPVRTVFPAKRVHATADDKRKKDGQTVTVKMSVAQAKAFEILKEGATVIIELHAKGPPKKKKK